jgi:hypothetical protein
VTTHRALAAAATLVSLAFALSTLERWLERRRRHELAWTVALALFAAGSAALWAGATLGWGPVSFRLFYLFGAIVNVPVLALGTVYLLGGERRGDRWALVVALASTFAAGVIAAAPLTGAIDPIELPRGSDVFGPLPRVLAAVFSGLGATVVLAGAAWSAVRRRLVVTNLLIAAGTLVLSAGGLLNSVVDEMDGFAISLVAGITLIFAGFLVSSSRRPQLPAQHLPAGPDR